MIEVAIIGGGPAGSAAAIACARAGLGTVLFERRDGAGEGASEGGDAEESVGPDCASLLAALGATCVPAGTPFAGIATGHRLAVFGGAGAGFHLRRGALDRALRQAAAEAGVELRLGVEVLGLESASPFRFATSAGRIAAPYVIDASGRRLWLARRVALGRRRLSPPLIAWRDILDAEQARTGAFARFTPHRDGWTWLAEVSAGRIVRIHLGPARAGEPIGTPAIRESATPHAATWQLGRRLAGDGWWIAGDAAAALDPAWGSGIAFALRSGLMAGRMVAAAVRAPALSPLLAARYHDACSREGESAAAALADQYRRLGVGVLG